MNKFLSVIFVFSVFFAPCVLAGNWYEGGTLSRATAIEWQQASPANKLATAADLVAAVYQAKKLAPALQNRIRSIDDFRPLAEALVKELDAAFEPLPDANQNRQVFANQKVPDTAVLLMLTSGWLQ